MEWTRISKERASELIKMMRFVSASVYERYLIEGMITEYSIRIGCYICKIQYSNKVMGKYYYREIFDKDNEFKILGEIL